MVNLFFLEVKSQSSQLQTILLQLFACFLTSFDQSYLKKNHVWRQITNLILWSSLPPVPPEQTIQNSAFPPTCTTGTVRKSTGSLSCDMLHSWCMGWYVSGVTYIMCSLSGNGVCWWVLDFPAIWKIFCTKSWKFEDQIKNGQQICPMIPWIPLKISLSNDLLLGNKCP